MVGDSVNFGNKPKHQEFDILNLEGMRSWLRANPHSAIVHLAALADMERCEKDPEESYKLNVLGSYNISKISREFGIYLVYMSTCAVFDGKKNTAYEPEDVPNPLNVYGRTKYIGELVVRDLAPNSLVVRTGWLFGGGRGSEKKFVNFCIRKLREGGAEIPATQDRFGSPTYIPDLIDTVKKFLSEPSSGVVHVVNEGVTSYFEVAKMIQAEGNFGGVVTPVKSMNLETSGVKRGKMEGLKSSRPLRTWQEAMRDYLRSFE